MTSLYVQDDTLAELGVLPDDASYRVPDLNAGDEVFVWPTPPSIFPDGNYIFRIEAHRADQPLHYSQHQTRFYLERS